MWPFVEKSFWRMTATLQVRNDLISWREWFVVLKCDLTHYVLLTSSSGIIENVAGGPTGQSKMIRPDESTAIDYFVLTH